MSVRILVFAIITLVAMLALFLVLLATDTALSVWQRLREAPLWLQGAYALLLAFVSAAATALAWRWLRPAGKSHSNRGAADLTAESLQDSLLESASAGVDVSGALAELRERARRKQAGEIHIAVFGEVSAGKSSLVNALLPDACVETGPAAGTTSQITRYSWKSASGDTVLITDLPGFNLNDDPRAAEEAQRAHLVIFLCDGDLTSSQAAELDSLRKLSKPILLAINKMDRYDAREAAAIVQRVSERSGISGQDIVTIQTGGREQVVRLLATGGESTEIRQRAVDIDSLKKAVQRHLDEDLEMMESLNDTAVLMLASGKLESARQDRREAQADELVAKYSKRAVVGAMAAVAPGSDLVIQGVLATRLVQELCHLYGVSVREVQVESFIRLAGGKLRNMSAITMAIAGNALKAFPGIGTLSGGLLHAVAYGLIFDSLGRAAAQTLASRGDLRPFPAARTFEDLMRENLESGAGRFAKLAVSQKAGQGTS